MKAQSHKYPNLRVHGVVKFVDGEAEVTADQAKALEALDDEYGVTVERPAKQSTAKKSAPADDH